MDKIIHDIVSVDLECSQRVEEAKKKKLDIQAHMNIRKKEIYDSYSEEYQKKAQEHKKKLEAQIKQTKEENEKEYKESLKQLSDLYEKHKDQWIKDIIQRCIDQ